MSSSTAEIDFEIAVHLGEFKNIDLSQKGIYAVRVKLLYGQQRRQIMPTGLFSAPSSLESQANEHQIPATRFISGCEVDDSNLSCTSRSIMIRYRGETHELNDGVCWRLTLSNLVLSSDGSSILCPDLMFISLELLFVELKGGDDTIDPMQLYNHPDDFIPDELSFNAVSSQLIALQQITSGFHQYYPITFTPDYFIELDMMIHGCITSIRYQSISFLSSSSSSPTTAEASRRSLTDKSDGTMNNRESVFEVQDTTSTLSITPRHRTRLSTTIDSISSSSTINDNYSKPSATAKIMSFFTNPEKLLFGSPTTAANATARTSATTPTSRSSLAITTDVNRNSGSSTSHSSSNKQLTQQQQLQQLQLELDAKNMAANPLLQLELTLSLTKENVERVFGAYTLPLVTNYQQAVNGSRIVLEHYNNDKNNHSLLETQITDHCILETSHDQILSELFTILEQQPTNSNGNFCIEVDKQLSQVVSKYINICNEQLTLRWALLNSAFRRALPPLKQVLYEEYRMESRIFWKQQQIIHTRPYEGSTNINSTKDDEMLVILNQHIAMEREREQNGDNLTFSKSFLFARGKQVFDYRIFRLPSRLPYLLIEQYVDFRATEYDSTIDSKIRRALISGTEAVTMVEHVIFLQHGFLGTAYDMRLLAHALSLIAPKANKHDRGPILVHTCTANEGSGNASIATMGKNLALEIKQYLLDKAPHLLNDLDDRNIMQEPMNLPGRISFIGHSLGGLMIRAALNEPELRPILPRLHVLMTIASPHLGNLFGDSQLVSTGMWALYTIKKYPALNELVLDDSSTDKEKSYLFRLSQNSTVLSRFRRIILVSSPKDQYVSTYSARLQITPKIDQDQKGMGIIVKNMLANILKNVRSEQLVRVTMVNNVEYAAAFATNNGSGKNTNDNNGHIDRHGNIGSAGGRGGQSEPIDVNNVIGRAAHICYLENDAVALQLIEAFEETFFNT